MRPGASGMSYAQARAKSSYPQFWLSGGDRRFGMARLFGMSWQEHFERSGIRIAHRIDLTSAGATGADLTEAVRARQLIRVRRDHYALPETDRHTLQAVRVGGRLGCVSALADCGVFAFDTRFTHIHMAESMSRSRSPRSRFVALTPENRDGALLHWGPLIDVEAGSEHRVGIVDALVQAVLCQQPWHAIASLDNALFLGRIDLGDLREIFTRLPQRVQYLRELVDGRSESGQESVLRMIMRQALLDYEIQVEIVGVGRVDMVIEGVLVVEADSREAHDSWERHVRDRTRDARLAARGYISLRLLYPFIMYDPDFVLNCIRQLLAASRHYAARV